MTVYDSRYVENVREEVKMLVFDIYHILSNKNCETLKIILTL